MQDPSAFRAARSTASDPAPLDGACRIKGNISSKGQRIYHLPGQQAYAQTRISITKGERWFCSQTDATLAGWRRARR